MYLTSSDRQHLRSACLRGEAAAALKLLKARAHSWGGCIGSEEQAPSTQQAAAGLLEPFAEDGGNTVLHWLCSGEALGLGGCLLLALAPHRSGPWPSRHQKRRAQLLACLLLHQPRLALLAGCRNAAGQTPLHAAVHSDSLQVLALLLAALRQVLGLGSEQQQAEEAGAAPQAPAAALQLLLSVQDGAGLTPLELALQRRQWAAARLLAAAAGGGLPLSLPQMEACSLVQRSLGGGGGGGFSHGGGGGGSAAGLPSGIHVSASGSTVTEALGGLLSKLWDAFGSTSAAAAENRGEAAQLERHQQQQRQQQQQQQQEGAAGDGAASGSEGRESGGRRSSPPLQLPLQLRLRPLSQDEVLELASEAEQRAPPAAASPAAAAAEGVGGAAVRGPAAAPGAEGIDCTLLRCIVCFEDFPPGWLSVRLPCGHATCDACWKGVLLASIDEGDPRRAECPEPSCSTRLPSAAAARLLPPDSLARFRLLLAQRYLATHTHTMRCCPSPECGQALHLPTRRLPPSASAADTGGAQMAAPAPACKTPAAAEGSAAAGAAAAEEEAAAAAAVVGAAGEAGLDAECGACGRRFCWRCGEVAHEPASCAQMRRWEGELAALRRAAPSADRDWLSSNTKRCPKCKAHIQKSGGCNHLTCRQCGHHFCWACGRDWAHHSTETGGFYHCSLAAAGGGTDGLPEYSGNAGSAGGGLAGPLAWVAGAWASLRLAAQQHQLQRHLRQFLRHAGGGGALRGAAAHMQLLLGGAGMLGQAGAGAKAAQAAPAGPQLLGVSPSDAGRMSGVEWGDLVAAAAASAADAVPPASLALPAAKAGAEAALAAAVAGPARVTAAASSTTNSTNSSTTATSSYTATTATSGGSGSEAAYLLQLAEAVAAARSLLQHSAVAMYQLPSGPPRRHLQHLAASLQRRLEQLEPLLLALPEREGIPALDHRRDEQHGTEHGGTGGTGITGGGGGLTGWLLSRLYGVEPPAATAPPPGAPERHPALAALPGDVLLQQLHFAAAVHQQRAAVRAGVAALHRDMRQMVAAARAGLYA